MKSNKKYKDLLIVDVQKSFNDYFNDKYLEELNKYCTKFSRVYQICDNTEGQTSPDYLFPNQVSYFMKSYDNVLRLSDIKYYFDDETCRQIESEWDNKNSGWYKKLKNGDIWLFIGDNIAHEWMYVNSDLVNFCERFGKTNNTIVLVGGSEDECLYDIQVLLNAFNIKYETDDLYVYSEEGCRFKVSDKQLLEKSLLQHAQDELKTSGMLDGDEFNTNISGSVLDLIQLFSSQGHSGFSAEFTKDLFDLLTGFKTLSPITSDPKEWQNDKELGGNGDLWQNLRDPSVFSEDGGKTWKSVDEAYKGSEFTVTEEQLDEYGDRYKLTLNIAGKDIGYVILEKVYGLIDIDEDEYGYLFPDDMYIKIEHLYIYPAHRGHNLSDILLDRSIKFTKDNNFNMMYLNASPILAETDIPLNKLIEIYERFGFKVFNIEQSNAQMYLKID